MAKIKGSISIGTIIFWGFLGWMWFGDSIKEVFHEVTKTVAVVTVNGEKKVIDVDKIIDSAVKKAESIIEVADEEEKPKPKPNPDEGKKMIAKESDDKYGDPDEKW